MKHTLHIECIRDTVQKAYPSSGVVSQQMVVTEKKKSFPEVLLISTM